MTILWGVKPEQGEGRRLLLDLATGVAALGLAAVFTASSLGKIVRGNDFRDALRRTYGFSGPPLAVASRLVPTVELGCAGLLVWPMGRTVGLALTTLLLLTFTSVAGAAWASGRQGDCGCWGFVHEQLGLRAVTQDVVLTLVSVTALALRFG